MNKLLQIQLRKHFGDAAIIPENMRELLNVISESYDHYEEDRKIIERSIELSSKEMIELNSELKKEKDELKKAHKEQKTFFEDINEIVFSIDMAANRLIQTSAACEKIYGYSPAEFMSDNDLWRKIIYPEDKHILEQLFQVLRQGKPVLNEYRIIHKNKSIRWIENKIIPTLGADGRLILINGVTSDITERKQAEDKLIITSNELQHALGDIKKIMDSSLDVICAVDADGYFVQVSAACETIWGYKADELIGKLMIDFVHPEDREKTQKAAVNVIAGNNMINFENRYIRKDGSFVPINWSARWDAKERIRYGVARDATEKKKSEKVFEIERQRFYDLFLTAPFSVGILKGPDHVYEMANPLCLQLIGKHDVIGKPVKDVLPELAGQGFIEVLDGVYKTGIPFLANEMHVKMDKEGNGKLVDMYVNAICQTYRNNKDIIEGIFFFVIDVSEQVLSRKKIEESELRYRSLIEQATDAICIADASLKFIDMNPYACQVLGYSKEEALRLSVMDIIFSEDLTTNPFQFAKVKTGEIIRNERRFKRIDGTSVIMEVSTQQMEDGKFIMFGHDISERKKAESILKESKDQLTIATQIAKLGYWEFDVTKNLFKFNDQFYSIYKTTAEEIGGYTMSSEQYAGLFVHPDDITMLANETVKAIKSTDPNYTCQIEHRIKYPNGEIGYMTFRFFIAKNEAGRTIKIFGAIQDITDRKKAEFIVKETKDQLTIATQIAKLGYWEFDVAKNQFKFNDQFYSIFKTTAEQAGGYTMLSERFASLFIHPDDIPMVAKEAADSIKSPDTFYNRQIEYRIKYANGGTGHVAARFFIVKNELGRTIKTFGAIQDITERKKAAEELTNNELRFRTLTSNAPVGIFQTDAKGKTIYVNETWLGYTGMVINEALGDGWIAAVHPDDRKGLIEHWSDESQKGITSISEYRLIDRKRNIRWVSGEAVPLFNTAGEIIGHIGTLSDITERKNAEVILRKNERQLTIATQIAKLGYWEFDILNDLFTFNDQFYAIFKTTAEKVGGYTMSSARYTELFVHPDEREIVGRSVEEAINSGDSHFCFKAEHRIIYATGEIGYISVHFYIVKDSKGHTIKTFGANQDITDRKKRDETLMRSEAALEIKNKQLEQKNKELEQFAYVASHDMQEPLRTTSSFVELLQKQYNGRLDEKADKYLTFIAQSSDRMKVLIKDLLDYSRIGRKKELAEVDSNLMLNEVLADLGKAINDTNAEIKAVDLPVISGYPTEIKQLFQNLIINSIKFRKQNTTPVIHISATEKSSYWEFIFKDNGIGIEEQHRERIFIIFQRLHTRNEYDGSGIGLAHCKKIVELHGGNIWIESIPGDGTTFHFTIRKNMN